MRTLALIAVWLVLSGFTPSPDIEKAAKEMAVQNEACVASAKKMRFGRHDQACQGKLMHMYDSMLPLWISQYRTPEDQVLAGKTQAKLMVRLRVDRMGALHLLEIDKSSGVAAVDQAGLAMVKRAAPLPKVPSEIPGNMLEYLIPIDFHTDKLLPTY